MDAFIEVTHLPYEPRTSDHQIETRHLNRWAITTLSMLRDHFRSYLQIIITRSIFGQRPKPANFTTSVFICGQVFLYSIIIVGAPLFMHFSCLLSFLPLSFTSPVKFFSHGPRCSSFIFIISCFEYLSIY